MDLVYIIITYKTVQSKVILCKLKKSKKQYIGIFICVFRCIYTTI